MVLLHPCIACQYGDHKHCVGGQAAPEGMIGGWRCSCPCNDEKNQSADALSREHDDAV